MSGTGTKCTHIVNLRIIVSAMIRLVAFGVLLFAAATTATGLAHACEPCALVRASQLTLGDDGSDWLFAVAHQYTSFRETPKSKEKNIENGEVGKDLASTIFSLGFSASDEFSFVANLPLIARSFETIEGYRRRDDDEVGIGDASLLAQYAIWRDVTVASARLVQAYGGVKLPTGDTGGVGANGITGNSEELLLKHHPATGAQGGRILSLGTGSYDFPVGLIGFLRESRWFGFGAVQYTFRQEGDYDYRFADDIVWSVGPGYYVHAEDDTTVGLRLATNGEYKGRDELNSQEVPASELSTVYVGPELIIFGSGCASGELAFDTPVAVSSSDSTIVPRYRVRGGVTVRF